VINSLLELIKNRLQDDLAKIVPKAQWHRLPLERVSTPTLPCVAMYDGEITFLPIRQDHSLEQNSREFQQAFWIDLVGQNSMKVEQLTSLIAGSITLNQQRWLAKCNPSSQNNQPPEDRPHHYQSATIATRHRFRQIQLIGASSDYDGGKVRSRLEFLVFGQLEIAQLKPDSLTWIETISATGTLGQAQNSRNKSDQPISWEIPITPDQPIKQEIDISSTGNGDDKRDRDD